jgi:hypothetical protein
MAPRKMMAEVGGTRKVIGSRIATPFTEPRPGIAPMNRPRVTPRITMPRFRGWKAIRKPSARRLTMSIVLLACALSRQRGRRRPGARRGGTGDLASGYRKISYSG